MRIVLFCENKYAIDILNPMQEYVTANHLPHEVLWYIHQPKIDKFEYADKVRWTGSIQEVYDFSPFSRPSAPARTSRMCRATYRNASSRLLPILRHERIWLLSDKNVNPSCTSFQ